LLLAVDGVPGEGRGQHAADRLLALDVGAGHRRLVGLGDDLELAAVVVADDFRRIGRGALCDGQRVIEELGGGLARAHACAHPPMRFIWPRISSRELPSSCGWPMYCRARSTAASPSRARRVA